MKYTGHGRRRVSERGIREEDITKAVSNPSFSFYDLKSSAYIVFKKQGDKYLFVAYSLEGDEIRVITTFITSNAQEIIEKKQKSNVWVSFR